jgi:hypothetical protein
VIKSQGSDTKLSGQRQPDAEAKGLFRLELADQHIPPLVTQLADGENGGMMMNEFPAKYFEVIRACSGSLTPIMNVTEYLERLRPVGIHENDLPVIQQLRAEDGCFHMEVGRWTNNRSWVRGYDTVLVPVERASSLFHERVTASGIRRDDPENRNALFHLLTAQNGAHRYPEMLEIALRATGERVRAARDAHAMGGTALPSPPGTLRGRGDHRRHTGPGTLQRPGRVHGTRLAHPRGAPTNQVLCVPSARDYRHRRRKRRGFRNTSPRATFWGYFYQGLWTGSQAQVALIRLAEISQAVHGARCNAIAISARDPELYRLLAEAHWRAFRAETSCNFFWGEAWAHRLHHDLDQASRLLDEAGAHFS